MVLFMMYLRCSFSHSFFPSCVGPPSILHFTCSTKLIHLK
uniref:Secreted protein n=1 Tax=Parascaris univalens TaxID=6257 RepID=A0A915CAK1_PARUN